jgi:hypothetical protein
MDLFTLVKKIIKFIIFLVMGFWLLFQLYFLISIILYISKYGYNKNDLFRLLYPFVGFIIEICLLYFIIRVFYNLHHLKPNTNIKSALDVAKERKKVILVGSLIALVFFIGILALLDFVAIGPGLPPPEIMSKWYIPGNLKGNEQPCTSFFPNITHYCNAANVSGKIFMNVWYFDSESEFLKGKDTLYRYLNKNGNVFEQELNISIETDDAKRDKANDTWIPIYVSQTINTTRYESSETSGYFLVYERPFLESREDYFIVYYGTKEMNLTEQTPALKKLIEESYYMSNKKGKVDSLKG